MAWLHHAARVSAIVGFPLLSALGGTALAAGTTTVWESPTGNWSEGTNWSTGEPEAADTAEIPPQRQVTVDQTGEVCSNLFVGVGAKGFGALVTVAQGSLTVGGTLRIGTASMFSTGSFVQNGGSVAVSELRAQRGGYTAGGGTASLGSCVIDGGALSIVNAGDVAVATDVAVEVSSLLTIAGGSFHAGDDGADQLVVRGEIALVNPNVEVVLQNLTLDGSNSRLRVTLGATVVDPITIAGTFARGGRFIVNDFDAPDGRYDILTAGSISGEFANVELPATGGWTWGVEGTTLYVIKGETPTADTSWGRLKKEFSN